MKWYNDRAHERSLARVKRLRFSYTRFTISPVLYEYQEVDGECVTSPVAYHTIGADLSILPAVYSKSGQYSLFPGIVSGHSLLILIAYAKLTTVSASFTTPLPIIGAVDVEEEEGNLLSQCNLAKLPNLSLN